MRICLIASAAGIASMGGLSGCSLADPPRPQIAQVDALPDSYSEADEPADREGASSQALSRQEWWRDFDDEKLDSLITKALDANLEIGQAITRIDEARARYKLERGALFPQINGGLEANYTDQPATGIGSAIGGAASGSSGSAGGAGQGGPSPSETQRFSFSTFTAQLEFAYEADIWGRLRNEARVAGSNYKASIAELQTARLAIITEVMRNYFDLLETAQLREVARTRAQILDERVKLAKRSFLRGLASSFELISLRESRREAQAQVPLLEASITATKTRLALLLGTYPSKVNAMLDEPEPLRLAVPMETVAPGIPASLLINRPDIKAAANRLDAGRYGVAAARAAQLPSLTFNARGGLESGVLDDLIDPQNWFANLLGAFTGPLFAGGQLDAQVDISKAQLQRRALAYGQSVLEAFGEVERALRQHRAALTRTRQLADDLAEARRATRLQRRRFERGNSRYADFLDSRLNVLNSRRLVTEAERETLGARLAVYRALGGGWSDEGRGSKLAGATRRPRMAEGFAETEPRNVR